MPAPATVDEFVDLIRKSAVLEEGRLTEYVSKIKRDPAAPKDLSSIAGLFVRDGLITYFQAEQFLQGKWKRFSIGKYKVLEKLGSGGMGQVFLCEHKLMRRRVAVKVLPTQKAADPSSLERFYREARAVAALDHPNIVRAYDIDQDDNLHFLVMEYVDGASLQEIIRKSGPMDPVRACHYMYWSAVGLQHAHTQGLIHRDVKPGNILVDRTGLVKILDLGLARFFLDEDDLLTKKYDESVLGTADYLAPEQAVDSHTVDGRADIYSLGATFYFLLTGQPPFAEGTVAQKLLWHQSKNPRPVREVRAQVPDAVARIVARMMAKKPEDRYQTPGELAEALLPFTQTPIPPPPDEEMPQLSVAAQGTASGPATVSAAPPRTTTSAPRTPPPAHGPKATMTATKAPPLGPKASPAARGNNGVSDADTQKKTQPAPVIEPIADSAPATPIWEAISAETANNSRADTDRKRRDGSSRRVKPAPKSGSKSGRLDTRRHFPLPVILTVAGGLVLLIAGVAIAVWLSKDRDKGNNRPPGTGSGEPRQLKVGAGQIPTVKQALELARDGDTIVIEAPVVEESVAVSRHKNLTITSADGKKGVLWKAPLKPSNYVLSLAGAEGARIAGITFEANSQVDFAVRLAGPCPGLVIEDCELRDGGKAALAFHDCTGTADRPVAIRRCRISNVGPSARGAVEFLADPSKKKNFPTEGSLPIQFHNCLVEGPPTGGGFNFDGSATVDIRNCRLWKGAAGLLFRRFSADRAPDLSWTVTAVNNTFHSQTVAGIWVEEATQVKGAWNSLKLNQNFFVGPASVKADGDAAGARFLAALDPNNVRKAGTAPPLAANLQPPPPPFLEVPPEVDVVIEPANVGRHLTYDRKSPLMTAASGKPAGAPPE